MNNKNLWSIFSLALCISLTGCKSTEPEIIGLQNGKLAQCPDKPNCVLSQDPDEEHAIEPLSFTGTAAEAQLAMQQVIAAYEGEKAEVITAESNYMYITFTTSLMKYVDDFELLILPGEKIHVRSASRVGRSDLGANKKRVEAIRAALANLNN
ncbi:MAG: DUF1499 domain-containing protein [Pseudomonadales bacterium]